MDLFQEQNMNILKWLTGIMMAGFLAATGCSRSTEPETPPTETEVAEIATPEEVATAKPKEAPTQQSVPASFGAHLVNRGGEVVSTDALQGRKIGLYFSASWCPPCRTFTPKLVAAYNELKAADQPFELVFVSSDRNESAMLEYMNSYQMEWLAVPYQDPARNQLAQRHRIRGIPSLIIVDDAGEVISTRGVQEVSSLGAAAFERW
jgi:thiol-disulfide isomerase/thioredoxin